MADSPPSSWALALTLGTGVLAYALASWVITRLPILALTANAMVGDLERCLQAGMDGYISKPIDQPKLLAEISRVGAMQRQR